MSVLVIDNYDSFTYNLVQYLGELKQKVIVFRNDKITIEEIVNLGPTHIVISPGPGRPCDAGISKDLIKELAAKIPILGVCLGHQCIGEVFGGEIVNAPELMHGKTSEIFHDGNSIFSEIPSPFTATRYHSLIVDYNSLEETPLKVIAKTKDNLIMALQHKKHKNLVGVQFHPESILTEHGHKLLKNFLALSLFLILFIISSQLSVLATSYCSIEDKETARNNPDSKFAEGIAQNPRYIIHTEDREFARNNPNTKFTEKIVLNTNYRVYDEDRIFAKNNPNTKFAEGITQSPNYSIKKEDKEFARKNPDTKFALGLVQNPRYEIDDDDREFARSSPDARIVEFLVKNPSY